MSEWNASNYRQRKSERLLAVKPEWVTNPETQEKFYLRRVGAMASMLAGYMPHELTNKAIAAWKEKGVEVGGETTTPTPVVEDGERQLQLMGKVVAQSCVIPKLVVNPQAEDEIDPGDLDDKDVLFIFRYATGQVNAQGVSMVGGQVMPMANLESFRKKPGRRSRNRDNGTKLQSAG